MGSKIPKRKSKRTPVRLRHKIEKRSAEKQRKERKHAKKHPELHRKKKEKLNIPNSFPYKDRLLAEIEDGRRLLAEEKEKRKEQRKQELRDAGRAEEEVEQMVDAELPDEESDSDGMEVDDDGNEGNAMAALLASARARAIDYEEEHGDSSGEDDSDDDMDDSEDRFTQASTSKETSRKQFDKLFKQVVDAADVILYVLDARDPDGTRSREVERQIMADPEKRLILILNKIDLVPPPVLKGWLTYLKRYFPTLPLKASNTAPNAMSFDHKALTEKGTSSALLNALKSFAHSKQLKRSVTVGVIGYPNVGKSSAINALMGRHGSQKASCPTGAEAGVTTSLREVKLDGKIKLLDSPGIVFPNETASTKEQKKDEQARLILLNVVPPKQIQDPVPAVTLLLRRFSTSPTLLQKLLDVYNIPPIVTGLSIDETTKSFLIEVARKRGRLGKGGIPNIESAATAVIMDWRAGRIQGWVEPPEGATAVQSGGVKIAGGETAEKDQKEIVGQWMEEFKLEGFNDGEAESKEIEMQV